MDQRVAPHAQQVHIDNPQINLYVFSIGKYSESTGSSSCSSCSSGKYSLIVGSNSESFCLACPSGMQTLTRALYDWYFEYPYIYAGKSSDEGSTYCTSTTTPSPTPAVTGMHV